MYDKLKLWFFRDLTDYQRRQLFSVFGMPVDEIGYSHGKQEHALRHVARSLTMTKPDTAPAPQVKPLDWKAFNEGFGHGRIYYGTGVFGHWYAVSRLKAGLWHCVHHVGEPAHLPFTRSLDEAKAAAQADYESRIIAALAPAPQVTVDGISCLYSEETPQGGVIRIAKWPEGYVLWYHGQIVWRSWAADGQNDG